MCKATPPRYRDPALRQRAAEMRATNATLYQIAHLLDTSFATVRRLLAPLPVVAVDPPRPSVCRHCLTRKVTRPKGLCWTCGMTPAIRTLYATISKYGHRGIRGRAGNRPTPEPTDAEPGSAAKVEVLVGRSIRGERLWNKADAVLDRRWTPFTPRVFHSALHDKG